MEDLKKFLEWVVSHCNSEIQHEIDFLAKRNKTRADNSTIDSQISRLEIKRDFAIEILRDFFGQEK